MCTHTHTFKYSPTSERTGIAHMHIHAHVHTPENDVWALNGQERKHGRRLKSEQTLKSGAFYCPALGR